MFSPSTRSLDQIAKLDEYKSVPSIEHIVLVDPDSPEIIVWSRNGDRSWSHETLRGLDALLALPAIGVELRLADLYAGLTVQTRPKVVPPARPPARLSLRFAACAGPAAAPKAAPSPSTTAPARRRRSLPPAPA